MNIWPVLSAKVRKLANERQRIVHSAPRTTTFTTTNNNDNNNDDDDDDDDDDD